VAFRYLYSIHHTIHNMQPNHEIKEVLDRINKGRASSEDKSKLEAWYNSFDDTETHVASAPDSEALKEGIWKVVQERTYGRKWKWKQLIPYAAVLATALGIYFFYLQNTPAKSTESLQIGGVVLEDLDGGTAVVEASLQDFLDSTHYVVLNTPSSSAVKSIATDKGQFTKVILPDGTKVSLNSQSHIILSDNVGEQGDRVVQLDGEAYFDVKTIPGRAFIVEAKDQKIRVLGTKFNVKAYKEQSQAFTSLYEGKIELSNEVHKFVLKPNDIAINDGTGIHVQNKDISYTEDWRSLTFSFENEKIEDVIYQLVSWYGISDVVYQSKVIPAQRISGKIGKENDLQDMLVILSNLTNGAFDLHNNILHVNFENN